MSENTTEVDIRNAVGVQVEPIVMCWISVLDELPAAGLPVIVFVANVFGNSKNTRRLRAQYSNGKTLHVHENSLGTDYGEYCEEDDTYFCPVGWFETNEFEDTNWEIEGEITHWMYLPEPP